MFHFDFLSFNLIFKEIHKIDFFGGDREIYWSAYIHPRLVWGQVCGVLGLYLQLGFVGFRCYMALKHMFSQIAVLCRIRTGSQMTMKCTIPPGSYRLNCGVHSPTQLQQAANAYRLA